MPSSLTSTYPKRCIMSAHGSGNLTELEGVPLSIRRKAERSETTRSPVHLFDLTFLYLLIILNVYS